MLVIFFFIWIIFNGKVTTEIVIFGIVIASLVYAFMCKFMDFSFKKDILFIKLIPKLCKVIFVLLIEIFKANIHTMSWIYNPQREMSPVIVDFSVDFNNPICNILLANMITLTPGTIVGELKGNHYTVHCLDVSMSENIDNSPFVKVLREMDEGRKEIVE
ncbi:MAG: Na+/H+ antiporter subunit E [Eubacteriales bacterium]|nr:Na+/H+ antiporter subunit E [Eubacteriales bacterium]